MTGCQGFDTFYTRSVVIYGEYVFYQSDEEDFLDRKNIFLNKIDFHSAFAQSTVLVVGFPDKKYFIKQIGFTLILLSARFHFFTEFFIDKCFTCGMVVN
jgi:hypothetical protein